MRFIALTASGSNKYSIQTRHLPLLTERCIFALSTSRWRTMIDIVYIITYFYIITTVLSVSIVLLSKIAAALIGYFDTNRWHHEAVSNPSHVVTLIHGTWARDADWTKPGSKLCQYLYNNIDGLVGFNTFPWKAGNSFVDRSKGSEDMKSKLLEIVQKFPDSKHFIVAHSHGGSIAIDAIDEEVSSKISGVICLSTPVLITHPRSVKYSKVLGVYTFSLFVFGSGMALTLYLFNIKSIGGFVAGIITFVTSIAVVLMHSDASQREFVSNSGICRIPKDRIVFLRVFGDEAASVINASHLAAYASNVIYSLIDKLAATTQSNLNALQTKIKEYFFLVLVSIPLLMLLATYILIYHSLDDQLTPLDISDYMFLSVLILILFLIQTLLFGGNIVGIPLAFGLRIIGVPINLIISFLGLATGPEMLSRASQIEICAEPTPVGEWDLAIFMPQPLTTTNNTIAFRHSMVYENDECLSYLTDWINSRS